MSYYGGQCNNNKKKKKHTENIKLCLCNTSAMSCKTERPSNYLKFLVVQVQTHNSAIIMFAMIKQQMCNCYSFL